MAQNTFSEKDLIRQDFDGPTGILLQFEKPVDSISDIIRIINEALGSINSVSIYPFFENKNDGSIDFRFQYISVQNEENKEMV